jgi:N6-L-threonylcarbamoyladenine synthase
LAVEGIGRYRLYGTTIDDAIGEAFDKVAKLLGLAYPGGPAIEVLAQEGDPTRFALPRPMLGREGADFSLSGLKTAVRLLANSPGFTLQEGADLAASFQGAVVDVLVDRSRSAMKRFAREFGGPGLLVVAGGVAANRAIGGALEALCRDEGFALKIPPPKLCTDNAAMVAWAGVERCQLGLFDELDVAPRARWPLQDAPGGGNGIAGAPEDSGALT